MLLSLATIAAMTRMIPKTRKVYNYSDTNNYLYQHHLNAQPRLSRSGCVRWERLLRKEVAGAVIVRDLEKLALKVPVIVNGRIGDKAWWKMIANPSLA